MRMYARAALIPRRVVGWGRLRILFLGRRRAGRGAFWSIEGSRVATGVERVGKRLLY